MLLMVICQSKIGQSLLANSVVSHFFKSKEFTTVPHMELELLSDKIQQNDLQMIDTGGYGLIYTTEINGKIYVVKKQKEASYLCLQGFQREIFALSLLSVHKIPNIVTLKEVYWNDNYVHLIFPYYEEGDLHRYLHQFGPLPVDSIRELSKQLFSGIAGMHKMRIAHCDLKSENILLYKKNDQLMAVIGDFGCSKYFKTKYVGDTLGSPSYLAPEQILQKKHSPFISDIFSMGVIFYEMIFKDNPFFDPNNDVAQISKNTLMFNPNDVYIEDKDTKDLLARLMEHNPRKRITAPQALTHPFITEIPKRKWFGFFTIN
eukprot:NODE_529_length_7157_cov_0.524795.p3 type:complete len:317 gc:universal NODE_529_length_7157_cov_0.524795:2107-3057(+)